MKRLLSNKSADSDVRVVLVVSLQSICWYRYTEKQITDRLMHSVDDDPLALIASCLWLKEYFENYGASIELIMDTELDDLDRVKLLDSTYKLSRSWHIGKVLWKLKREYPDAVVSKLPGFLYPEVASVLYSRLADQSAAWLETLVNSGVVVSHAVTSTQLLCDSYKHCHSPVLLYRFDGESRHRLLLIVKGSPLHMRHQVDMGAREQSVLDQPVTRVDLNQAAEYYLYGTVDYLRKSVFSSLENMLLVIPHELNDVRASVVPDEYLVRHLLQLPCDISSKLLSLEPEPEPETYTRQTIGNNNFITQCLSEVTASRSSKFSLSKFSFMQVENEANPYSVTLRSVGFRSLLGASIAIATARQRVANVRSYTVATFVVFLIVILLCSVSGVRSLNAQENSRRETTVLSVTLDGYKKQLYALHDSPYFVMESMHRIHSFDVSPTTTPSYVMGSVSEAVREFPLISLTGFSWSVLDEKVDSDYVTVNSVSTRDNYWDEESTQTSILVEMTGGFANQSSLRLKQRKLDNFLGFLAKSDRVSRIEVANSPAESATSSHLITELGGAFKVQFMIRSL